MAAPQNSSFDELRERLEQIVDEVNAEGITLDESLALYEEAVKLGLSACDMSEQDALEAYGAEQAESRAAVEAGEQAESRAAADAADSRASGEPAEVAEVVEAALEDAAKAAESR